MAPAESDPLIDAEHAAFLMRGVSISVGSCDAEALPSLTRAIGCRLSVDRSRLSVFVSAEQSRDVLGDIRASGRVAVVFTEPSTHRTIQVKGADAVVEPLADGDLQRICTYREAFATELVALGYSSLFGRALVDFGAGEVVAVSFTPNAAFSQTPGPKAGTPLREAR
jgi:hypothetical protein